MRIKVEVPEDKMEDLYAFLFSLTNGERFTVCRDACDRSSTITQISLDIVLKTPQQEAVRLLYRQACRYRM